MKKLLMIGGMILLVWFNMRSLFGREGAFVGMSLNNSIAAVNLNIDNDSVAQSKARLKSNELADVLKELRKQLDQLHNTLNDSLEVAREETMQSLMDVSGQLNNKLNASLEVAREETMQNLMDVSGELKNTLNDSLEVAHEETMQKLMDVSEQLENKLRASLELANGETLQLFLNLLAKEIVIVQQLIMNQRGDFLRITVNDRNESLLRSSPRVRELYENTMDLATRDDRLTSISFVDRVGRVYTRKRTLNVKNKKAYLRSVRSTLENTYVLVQKMQYHMSSILPTDIQDLQAEIRQLRRLDSCKTVGGKKISRALPRQRTSARKRIQSPSLVDACKKLSQALDIHVSGLNKADRTQS